MTEKQFMQMKQKKYYSFLDYEFSFYSFVINNKNCMNFQKTSATKLMKCKTWQKKVDLKNFLTNKKKQNKNSTANQFIHVCVFETDKTNQIGKKTN